MKPTVVRNPLRAPVTGEPSRHPLGFHRRLPGYGPTPLRVLPALATELGVGGVLLKDESSRLGLPAFKMLGASWATYRALVARLGHDVEPWATVDDLRERLAPLQPVTLATATDGNHGRAVARMARLTGCRARIWVPEHTAAARIEAIESEGAEVTVTPGGYDDAVADAAAAAAADDRTLVVSDTSWEGYEDVPAWVVEGYSTIFWEIEDQLAADGLPAPGVVVVPVGVGALAAAAVAHFRRPGAPEGTILVSVEPTDAACVLASAEAGGIVTLPGPQRSIMAGLNCGTPSPIAWPLVSTGFDWLVAVDDDQAREAMRTLAAHGVVAGETGAASLAGLVQAAGVVPPGATALVLCTEGATDPVAYREIVGVAP